MLREIVLDTETTGLDAKRGDRLIEIGCVEIINRRATGVEFHRFINPGGKDVHPDAERVHGISNKFLIDKPSFGQVATDFLAFIGDDTLVIHNANFDIGFINMELEKIKQPLLLMDRVVDTLLLARRKHPGGPNTLDALCKRYGIDNTQRTKHGAIVDSLLLADVYLELLGERQSTLGLNANELTGSATSGQSRGAQRHQPARQRPQPLAARLSAADEAAHAKFVESLGPNSIWKKMSAKAASA
jgi:DNA polymerase III subunit epsilon